MYLCCTPTYHSSFSSGVSKAWIDQRLLEAFRDVHNEQLDAELPRRYITLVQAKSRLNLSEDDLLSIAEQNKDIRLRYKRVNFEDVYPSSLLIEHYTVNTDYGHCTTGSARTITIISPSSYDHPSLGHFSLCLSRQLKANYISNELFGSDDSVDPNASYSFARNNNYYPHHKGRTEFEIFKDDIRKHAATGSLTIIVRSKSDLQAQLCGNTASSYNEMISFGVMKPDGLRTLIADIHDLTSNLADKTPPFHAEHFGRRLNDIHCFIQQETRSNVLSVYIAPALLEWATLENYYKAIKDLADEIQKSIVNVDREIIIHYPPNFTAHHKSMIEQGQNPRLPEPANGNS